MASLSHCLVSASSRSSITRLLHKPFNSKPLKTTLTPLLIQTTTRKISSVRTRATLADKGQFSTAEEQKQPRKMKYYDSAKLSAMIGSRAIEKKLPYRYMGLDLRTDSVSVVITTPDNAGIEVLSPGLSWEQLSEKLPKWISEYSIGGIVLGNLTDSPTSPTGRRWRTLEEQQDLIEKLMRVGGIEDGMPYTFIECPEEDMYA